MFTGRGEDEEMENKGEQRKDELVKDRMEPEKDREGWTPCQVIHLGLDTYNTNPICSPMQLTFDHFHTIHFNCYYSAKKDNQV